MPPRHAYWTILVDNAPTAFRSSSKEELLPTFNRLKEKHESAVMKWWQNGKLWDSRLDAQEAMRARGEMGRRGDFRQSDRPSFRDRKPQAASHRPDFKPQAASRRPFGERKPQVASRKPFVESREERNESGKLDWKPKGEFTPAPRRFDRDQDVRKPQAASRKPEWKPKPQAASRKPEWKPKPQAASRRPSERAKLDWTPKSGYTDRSERPATEKRKWVPKAEYKKSLGIEPKRDSKWRPGGEHRDPKQKYKDAKKAKWTQFKQNIRKRWEAKGGKKRRDEES